MKARHAMRRHLANSLERQRQFARRSAPGREDER
jgi:hypothetical protein